MTTYRHKTRAWDIGPDVDRLRNMSYVFFAKYGHAPTGINVPGLVWDVLQTDRRADVVLDPREGLSVWILGKRIPVHVWPRVEMQVGDGENAFQCSSQWHDELTEVLGDCLEEVES